MLRTTIIAALALSASPVSAAERDASPLSVRVSTADLDLSGEAGVTALDRRIKAAVHEVCPFQPTTNLWTVMANRACMRSAQRSVADARTAVIARSRLTNTRLAATVQ